MGDGESLPRGPAVEPYPGLVRNFTSLIGGALAAISLANIVFLVLVSWISPQPSPYLGILAFLVFPAFLILGLVLVPVGMLLERRRRRKPTPGEIPQFPQIDLNRPAQRNALAFFVSSSAVLLLLSALGSYRAYEFTDSVEFCGQLCHAVMAPEYTTYLQSPHARVPCVDCHVGPGAGGYIRSKLSGSYQVYALAFNKYPRPIPTPVANLRPAQETCERCHWPSKFYGTQLKVFYHYAPDEKNTPRQIRMLLNIGGAEASVGLPSGIHWHMNLANQITYVATDAGRQVIPWVQAKDMQGKVTIYTAKDSPLSSDRLNQAEKRRMDCIDCHDRPSHIFPPPDRSVDGSLRAGRIEPFTALHQAGGRGRPEHDLPHRRRSPKQHRIRNTAVLQVQVSSSRPRPVASDRDRRFRSPADIPVDNLSCHEDRLAVPPGQCGSPLFSGLLSLPRWPAHKRRGQGHPQGLQHLPHPTGATGRGSDASGPGAADQFQPPGGYRRSHPGKLQRLPLRRRRP